MLALLNNNKIAKLHTTVMEDQLWCSFNNFFIHIYYNINTLQINDYCYKGNIDNKTVEKDYKIKYFVKLTSKLRKI